MATVHITDQNFEQEVLKSDKPVLVDFWAPWCGPCHMIAPVLEELSETYKDKLKIVKLNVDENQENSMKYQIMSIPNMKIFKDGQVVDEIIGAAPRQMIEEKLKAQLSPQ